MALFRTDDAFVLGLLKDLSGDSGYAGSLTLTTKTVVDAEMENPRVEKAFHAYLHSLHYHAPMQAGNHIQVEKIETPLPPGEAKNCRSFIACHILGQRIGELAGEKGKQSQLIPSYLFLSNEQADGEYCLNAETGRNAERVEHVLAAMLGGDAKRVGIKRVGIKRVAEGKDGVMNTHLPKNEQDILRISAPALTRLNTMSDKEFRDAFRQAEKNLNKPTQREI